MIHIITKYENLNHYLIACSDGLKVGDFMKKKFKLE